jgi:hypothetical protein
VSLRRWLSRDGTRAAFVAQEPHLQDGVGLNPEHGRDLRLSETTREIVIGAVSTDVPGPRTYGPVAAANSLRVQLGELDMLTDGERHALGEWLDRIASDQPR